MKEVLRRDYGVEAETITEVPGGWAARAFRVQTRGGVYFAKMYEKSRPSTAKWTAHIEAYTPLLAGLGEGALRGQVPVPIRTKGQGYRGEDARAVYLLYAFIEGDTVGEIGMSEKQRAEVIDLVARLHAVRPDAGQIPPCLVERFDDVEFGGRLAAFLQGDQPEDIRLALHAYAPSLEALTCRLEAQRQRARQKRTEYVLCHTDIHPWNLMQSGERLLLIDWEGLKFAPREADFVALQTVEYAGWMERYRRLHPGYTLDDQLLRYYRLRRKCEDIWEFIEQLLEEPLSPEKRAAVLGDVRRECRGLEKLLRDA